MKKGKQTFKLKSPCFFCGEPVMTEVIFDWDTTDLVSGQAVKCQKCGKENFVKFDKEAWEKANKEERLSFIKTLFDVASQIGI